MGKKPFKSGVLFYRKIIDKVSDTIKKSLCAIARPGNFQFKTSNFINRQAPRSKKNATLCIRKIIKLKMRILKAFLNFKGYI